MHRPRCHNIIGKVAAAVPYGRAFRILPGVQKKRQTIQNQSINLFIN